MNNIHTDNDDVFKTYCNIILLYTNYLTRDGQYDFSEKLSKFQLFVSVNNQRDSYWTTTKEHSDENETII